jgi:hypothetical protein
MAGSPLRGTPLSGRVDDIPVVRFGPVHGLDQTVELVVAAIRHALTQGQPHLLVDAAAVVFAPPSLAVRHRIVRQWAEAANGRLRLAVVVRPDCIDPEHFGVVAAANFGLAGQVFDQEPDALAWLHAELDADLRAAATERDQSRTGKAPDQRPHDRQ